MSLSAMEHGKVGGLKKVELRQFSELYTSPMSQHGPGPSFLMKLVFMAKGQDHHLPMCIPLAVPKVVTDHILHWVFHLMFCITVIKGKLYSNNVEVLPNSEMEIQGDTILEYRVGT
jgi:hypothetical protein